MPGNYWSLVNQHSGKCMDVQALSMDDGGSIQQFSCNGGPDQNWIVADAAPGVLRLVARHSGKSLEVKEGGTADGTKIIQSAWHATPSSSSSWWGPRASRPRAPRRRPTRARARGKGRQGEEAKAP